MCSPLYLKHSDGHAFMCSVLSYPTQHLKQLSSPATAGLYEYLCTTLRLSESVTNRKVIVHEMMISDEDERCIRDSKGASLWRKPASAYRAQPDDDRVKGFSNVSRVQVHSNNGIWDLVDEDRVSHLSCCHLASLES
jgi:hypothetical protein